MSSPLKFVYATDLHGDVDKYEVLYDFAVEHSVDFIHIGADCFPKFGGTSLYSVQREFLSYFRGYIKRDFPVLFFFGNDDVYHLKDYVRVFTSLLDEHPKNIGGYDLRAYGYVPDYKFSLKTACKIDHPGWVLKENYMSDPLEINESGVPYVIYDIDGYFRDKGTIEEDLKTIYGHPKMIMASHCPPFGIDLDVTDQGRFGSKAVYDWIEREQPLIVLSGHFHWSPNCGIRAWKGTIGNTLVIQPGQAKQGVAVVLIEIDGQTISADRAVLPT